jgi:hypothetical protein
VNGTFAGIFYFFVRSTIPLHSGNGLTQQAGKSTFTFISNTPESYRLK